MDLISMLFVGILPAGLLMWAGNVIRTRATDEKTGKNWLWFLIVGFGLSLIASVSVWLIGEYAFNISIPWLAPITFGFIAALALHLIQERNISTKWSVLVFLLIVVSFYWISFANGWAVLFSFILVAVLTALAWLMWQQKGQYYPILFIVEVILLGISIRVTDTNRILDMNPHWLASMLSTMTYLFIPWAGVVLSALLIRRHLASENHLHWRSMISSLFMVAVLFLMIGYEAMLISLWDVATDGLGWIFLWLTTSTIGIGSAMLMAWSMPRKRLWIPILFAIVIPLVLLQSHNLANYDKDHAWGTKPVIVTENRAVKIEKAIERYYKDNDKYPQTLNDLTPRYLLYIPNPLIIPGQDWCYEGGTDHYRFGYVYRQYFSTPASVQIHSSAGESSNANWGCEDQAAPYSKPLGF